MSSVIRVEKSLIVNTKSRQGLILVTWKVMAVEDQTSHTAAYRCTRRWVRAGHLLLELLHFAAASRLAWWIRYRLVRH